MRCVNIDWLEVYCLESNDRFPCNADYFRRQGYYVSERDYGTRQYAEMFTLVNENNDPLIEIRRNPKAGSSDFSGFVPQSCHLRIPNWRCYLTDIVAWLRDFMMQHDYIFKRIFRIDICYDFIRFDSGDLPRDFARRYLERKYRKINQCKIHNVGQDSWNDFEWETLAWGNETSMVTTKLYNKSKEIDRIKHDKPYIRSAWFACGLVDSPVECTVRMKNGTIYKPEIWRVEFSMRSKANNWLIIEDQSGKRQKKKAVPHHLNLFDSPDKLWQRFQDLAFHYFHFKYREYKDEERALTRIALNADKVIEGKELKRKDRCRDKVLFYWDKDHEFAKINQLPKPSHKSQFDEILKRKLAMYRLTHSDMKIRQACDVILGEIQREETRRVTPDRTWRQTRALQAVIALKMGGDERTSLEILEEVRELLENEEIF